MIVNFVLFVSFVVKVAFLITAQPRLHAQQRPHRSLQFPCSGRNFPHVVFISRNEVRPDLLVAVKAKSDTLVDGSQACTRRFAIQAKIAQAECVRTRDGPEE